MLQVSTLILYRYPHSLLLVHRISASVITGCLSLLVVCVLLLIHPTLCLSLLVVCLYS